MPTDLTHRFLLTPKKGNSLTLGDVPDQYLDVGSHELGVEASFR